MTRSHHCEQEYAATLRHVPISELESVMGEVNYPPKLGREIARLKEIDAHWTADLLVGAQNPTEGSSMAREGHLEPQDESTAAADGYWVGARGVLLPDDGEDNLGQELKDQAATAETDEAKASLLKLWITAEPTLSVAELGALHPLVFGRIFGEVEQHLSGSRNSDNPQGGGY
jgi:hypothetical protein